MDINTAKQELRKCYMTARKNIPAACAAVLSAHIAQKILLFPQILEARLIMAYHRTGSEVDTSRLIECITNTGRDIALPYCRDNGDMGIGRIHDMHIDLVPGKFGVMEPADRLKDNVHIGNIDAVVCPGVAFDEDGGRLGRGGGYYDRFLQTVKGKILIIGCAFDCQISDTPLPRDEHDVFMDIIATEKRIINL